MSANAGAQNKAALEGHVDKWRKDGGGIDIDDRVKQSEPSSGGGCGS